MRNRLVRAGFGSVVGLPGWVGHSGSLTAARPVAPLPLDPLPLDPLEALDALVVTGSGSTVSAAYSRADGFSMYSRDDGSSPNARDDGSSP